MFCRLCVNESSNLLNIFHGECSEIGIANLIAKYFTFKVPQDDDQSNVICRTCFESVQNFFYFCNFVEQAQEKWQSIANLEIKTATNEEECLDESDDQIDEGLSSDNEIISIKNDELNNDDSLNLKEANSESFAASSAEDKHKKAKLSEEFARLIASNTNLSCEECSEPMDSFKVLKRHFKDVHSKVGYMMCCGRKFFRAADLADHINIHLNPEYFKCAQCEKCFSCRYSLDFHLRTFHVDESAEIQFYKCSQCSRKFLSRSVLDRHKKTHCGEDGDDNNHICMECGKGYPSETKLKAHRINVHTMVYRQMCHLCGKVVRGKKALERHQLQHAGINPKVKCEICGTELSTKGILKAHMIALHPKDSSETHVCNVCGKNAPSKRALKYHMDYVHNCERSHKCNLCDKSFKRLQTLKEHITTHTGDRLYMCPHCPKTFKVNSNMHHHRKLKHPKEFEENRKNRTSRKPLEL